VRGRVPAICGGAATARALHTHPSRHARSTAGGPHRNRPIATGARSEQQQQQACAVAQSAWSLSPCTGQRSQCALSTSRTTNTTPSFLLLLLLLLLIRSCCNCSNNNKNSSSSSKRRSKRTSRLLPSHVVFRRK